MAAFYLILLLLGAIVTVGSVAFVILTVFLVVKLMFIFLGLAVIIPVVLFSLVMVLLVTLLGSKK